MFFKETSSFIDSVLQQHGCETKDYMLLIFTIMKTIINNIRWPLQGLVICKTVGYTGYSFQEIWKKNDVKLIVRGILIWMEKLTLFTALSKHWY